MNGGRRGKACCEKVDFQSLKAAIILELRNVCGTILVK